MADRLLICKHNDGLGHCDVFGGEYCVESPCQHEELVEYAPVVHGEWEKEFCSNGWHEWDNLICKNCGKKFERVAWPSEWHFCPNCGADMRERKGDDGNEA